MHFNIFGNVGSPVFLKSHPKLQIIYEFPAHFHFQLLLFNSVLAWSITYAKTYGSVFAKNSFKKCIP